MLIKQGASMTQEQSKVINIDGKDYKESDLNQEQTYCIRQIRSLQNKCESLRFELDSSQMALQFATSKLISSLTTSEKDDVKIAN
tara:strand:- start:7683 stop:7937 length:255 start_codon:yes stop_codon:yes gene_type:complete